MEAELLEFGTSGRFRLRAGSRQDYRRLFEIWRESVAATHHFLAADDFHELEKNFIPQFLPACQEIWICEHDNESVGFLGCNGAKVEMLFVDPQFFGLGVGTALLALAFGRQGPLSVEVNEQNPGALAFYRRNGFKIIGRQSGDNQGKPYPLLKLRQTR